MLLPDGLLYFLYMSFESSISEVLTLQVQSQGSVGQWFGNVWAGLKATSALELSANFSYLISVWLAGKNSVHTWWTGIIGVLLFAVLFYQIKLYADVTLQVFYVVTSIWGWYVWQKGKGQPELPISRVSVLQLLSYVLLAVLVTLGYGSLLYHYTDATAPFPDSVVLTGSVAAQFLLMNRKLENWLFWIVVDLVAVPLYASKEYYFTSGVYVLFLANAVWGFINWFRLFHAEKQHGPKTL